MNADARYACEEAALEIVRNISSGYYALARLAERKDGVAVRAQQILAARALERARGQR